MMRRRRRLRRFIMPEITLTPLIDTALTLLVIFMVTAPMVQHGIKVELPQGQSKEVGSDQELVITLGKDRSLYFNSYPVKRHDLVEQVKRAMNGRSSMPVYIRADRDISYGDVIEVVDQLKFGGVSYVAMSTRALDAPSR